MAVNAPRWENKHAQWRLSVTLDETGRCIRTYLEDDHCLSITDMQREMAAQFSHKASATTIVCALQQLEKGKVNV